ncbi:2-hydroxyglutaryl-CoA dehydratase [Trichlorobacter lovleyi]|uniref:acyl-CoA dehydratase activase n=1 Tax=Trichlorobacter lovleyi TaxID=313985 RepID=UPI0022408501|nr:acyl-CoA dehydratase activase [Trichlorobacter lovleyi]QOX79400.1 2-hydroxyglutaryl-CoA dehydratase [Trichlorobacter lovleyi]
MISLQAPFSAGIDVGSTQTKAVLLDASARLAGTALIDTGFDIDAAARTVYARLLAAAGLGADAVSYVAGTGYGRFRIAFGDLQVTEISCHARGAVHLFPATRTVLDMGGQDTKAIRVAADGGVIDFCMNDKCAAGTGRFLSAAAAVLEMPLDELAAVAATGRHPVTISTTCTVFAESEILAWVARGKSINDILLGAHQAIASRSLALLKRVGLQPAITFTGGVSRNSCMVAQLERLLGSQLQVGEQTPFAGALGAALFARDRLLAGRQELQG